MNYSRKNNRNKAIIISWVVCLVVGGLLGWGFTAVLTPDPEPIPTPTEEATEETVPMYGTRDGRIFTDGAEMSRDWGDGDLNFVPLDVPLDEGIQEFIYYLSYGYYIDFPFVMGLIQQESNFKADAISGTDDYGLMQINTCNHEWLSEQLGITDFLDPYQNIRAGLYILRNLFEKYDDPAKVLMAYNMGEYGASVLWDKGIYESRHSRKIMENALNFENYLSERMNENE